MRDPRGSHLCVLIIEDYDDLRETLSALLKLKGYAVETAANGQEALSILKNRDRAPDLVVTDLRMPNDDGWSLRRKMLEDEELAAIPVIVVSSTDARGREEELQAVAYLEKPVSLAELIEVIDKHRG